MARCKKDANVTIMDYGWIPAQAEEMKEKLSCRSESERAKRKRESLLKGRLRSSPIYAMGKLAVCKWNAAIAVYRVRG